jgi:hypothetical protein
MIGAIDDGATLTIGLARLVISGHSACSSLRDGGSLRPVGAAIPAPRDVEECDDPTVHPAPEHVSMCGCLIVGLLVVLVFVLVPLPLWPLLVVGLVVLVVVAAALGFLKGVIGVIFRR